VLPIDLTRVEVDLARLLGHHPDAQLPVRISAADLSLGIRDESGTAQESSSHTYTHQYLGWRATESAGGHRHDRSIAVHCTRGIRKGFRSRLGFPRGNDGCDGQSHFPTAASQEQVTITDHRSIVAKYAQVHPDSPIGASVDDIEGGLVIIQARCRVARDQCLETFHHLGCRRTIGRAADVDGPRRQEHRD
jgi:hypothetical protein